MPRQIFKGRVIATAGPLPGQLTVENLKRWTELRKGRFSEDFDETVTHLLCTREQFSKKLPRVKLALSRGKRLHIVHYDWFEFSTVHEKREPERQYSMRNLSAKQNARRREQARIEKGIKDGEKLVNTNLFHIYVDREYFPYQIDITRDDEVAGEYGQRYTLCLWESDAKPHLYWFTAKFLKKKGNSHPSYHRPSACSGKWRTEMDHFTAFFKAKTGIDWDERVIREKTTDTSLFQYSPPAGGKPVGRRLRLSYDHCRQVNAELRGLPWPLPESEPEPAQLTQDEAEAPLELCGVHRTESMDNYDEEGDILGQDNDEAHWQVSRSSSTPLPSSGAIIDVEFKDDIPIPADVRLLPLIKLSYSPAESSQSSHDMETDVQDGTSISDCETDMSENEAGSCC